MVMGCDAMGCREENLRTGCAHGHVAVASQEKKKTGRIFKPRAVGTGRGKPNTVYKANRERGKDENQRALNHRITDKEQRVKGEQSGEGRHLSRALCCLLLCTDHPLSGKVRF